MDVITKENIYSLVGREIEPSDWFQVNQDRVNTFADCTLDHQFIHVDPEKAAASAFGGTIAHGFLSLSLISYFAEQRLPLIEGLLVSLNYGFDKVRFLTPVATGSWIRGSLKIVNIDEKSAGQFNLKTEVTIEIKGQDKPALIAEWLTRQVIR